MAAGMTAVKPVYNRRTRCYDVEVIRDADPIQAHYGYMVFDDAAYALACIERGTLISHWSTAKVEAVKVYLSSIINAKE